MNMKPMMLVNDDLAEGVYAASGAAVKKDITYSLDRCDAWDGNKNYYFSITNNSSKKVDSVTLTFKVNGTVNSIGGNVSGSVNGSTATVTYDNYGHGFEANSTVGNIYMHVTGVDPFSLE